MERSQRRDATTAQPMNPIEMKPVLEFFRRLAERGEDSAAEVALKELAQLFRVDGIGLTGADADDLDISHPPARALRKAYPWHTDTALLDRIRDSLGALAFSSKSAAIPRSRSDGAEGLWLANLVAEPRDGDTKVAWLYRDGSAGFSDVEQWLWTLASQVLVRWNRRTAPATAPLQRQLEQTATITSRLTHDFGNYLTGIMGFTELSLTQAPADSLLRRYLHEVLQSAKGGAEWVHRLHHFCRRVAVKSWPVALSAVLAVEESRLRSAGTDKLRWETKLPDDLPLLEIEGGALQIVVQEVINNAREGITGQASIVCSARVCELNQADCALLLGAPQPGTFVELTVTDDGPGIPEEIRARLLRELFFSTKPKHRGIGLLMVYGILRRFHGGFRLAPPAAQGTTVQLYLPVATAYSGLPVLPSQPRVLVAHGDPILLESMRKILESTGCQIVATDSSQAAMNEYLTRKSSFALVVADVSLAPHAGFDLARRVLEFDSKANFLFLQTQNASFALLEEQLFKRFSLLRSPFDPQALVTAVQTALAQDDG